MLEVGWELTVGVILEVRVAATIALGVHFVGASTDHIGACYFATYAQLDKATISEFEHAE